MTIGFLSNFSVVNNPVHFTWERERVYYVIEHYNCNSDILECYKSHIHLNQLELSSLSFLSVDLSLWLSLSSVDSA